MPSLRAATSLALLLALPVAADAQDLRLSAEGGAIGQETRFLVEGAPGRHYWLLFDFRESGTDLGGGLQLDISLDFLNYSAIMPGFMGSLNGQGRARVDLVLPNAPALDAAVMSLQCAYCSPVDEVSNLLRLTPAVEGSFEPTLGAPDLPFVGGLAVPQQDGSLRLFGETIPLVHRYHPTLEEFEVEGLGCDVGLLSTQTVLADGRVLLAGGLSLTDGQPTAAASLFDPETGECTSLTMPAPRAGHAAALNGDGEVLICGGFETLDLADLLGLFAGLRADAFLFDPSDLSFRPVGAMLEPKALHTATTTADGDVLVAGGLTLLPIVDIPFVSPTAYLWNNDSEAFGVLPLLFDTGRMAHGATLLSNGDILLVGGLNVDFTTFLETGDLADLAFVSVDSGERWEDGFLGGSFDPVPGLAPGRALPAVVALPGRRALIAGGLELSLGADLEFVIEPKVEADLYVNQGFQPTSDMNEARVDPIAIRLADGTVLLVGGGGLQAEVYQVPED